MWFMSLREHFTEEGQAFESGTGFLPGSKMKSRTLHKGNKTSRVQAKGTVGSSALGECLLCTFGGEG